MINLEDIEVLMNEEWVLSKATDDFLRQKNDRQTDSEDVSVSPLH
jgi:hypothetical protein